MMTRLRRAPVGPEREVARIRWAIATSAAVVVAVLVLFATVPVPQTSMFHLGMNAVGTTPGGPPPPSPWGVNASVPTSLCPAGADASVQFAATSTDSNWTFSIVAPNGTPVWTTNDSQSAVTFVVPTCGTYDFLVDGAGMAASWFCRVNVALAYEAPLL